MPATMDDKGNVTVTCDDCGKPIVSSNEYGMFCEDKCRLEESKKAKAKIEEFIGKFCNLLGIDLDDDE